MGSRDLPLLGGILFEALQWAEAATVGLGRFPTKSGTVRLYLGHDHLFGRASLEPIGRGRHGTSTESGWVDPGRPGSARFGSARVGSVRVGSARVGPGRFGSARVGPIRVGSVRVWSARVGLTRAGSARAGLARAEL